MSDLVVITFPDETSGPAALQSMREAQRNAGLALKDVAAVTKDADGKVHTHNETDSTTLTGIVGGGFLGLLLGLVFFPIGGLVGLKSPGLHELREPAPRRGIVLDNQDALAGDIGRIRFFHDVFG